MYLHSPSQGCDLHTVIGCLYVRTRATLTSGIRSLSLARSYEYARGIKSWLGGGARDCVCELCASVCRGSVDICRPSSTRTPRRRPRNHNESRSRALFSASRVPPLGSLFPSSFHRLLSFSLPVFRPEFPSSSSSWLRLGHASKKRGIARWRRFQHNWLFPREQTGWVFDILIISDYSTLGKIIRVLFSFCGWNWWRERQRWVWWPMNTYLGVVLPFYRFLGLSRDLCFNGVPLTELVNDEKSNEGWFSQCYYNYFLVISWFFLITWIHIVSWFKGREGDVCIITITLWRVCYYDYFNYDWKSFEIDS